MKYEIKRRLDLGLTIEPPLLNFRKRDENTAFNLASLAITSILLALIFLISRI